MQSNLNKAVQAVMEQALAPFYFLAGFSNLLVCDDNSSSALMFYQNKKNIRNETVDMFKAALQVSLIDLSNNLYFVG